MTTKNVTIHPRVAQELLQRRGKSQINAIVRKVRDAFEESKVKRDAGGKFSTTGAGGGTAEHHEAQAAHHKEQLLKADSDEAIVAHAGAMGHHERAAHELRKREALGSGGTKEAHEALQSAAQANANKAHEHASKVAQRLSGGEVKPTAPAGNVAAGLNIDPAKLKRLQERQAMLRESGSPRYSGGASPKHEPGPNSVTHHKDLQQGMHLFNSKGQKVDEVEGIGKAMRGERTVHTRAGYEHVTQGGHLPSGMYAQPPKATQAPAKPAPSGKVGGFSSKQALLEAANKLGSSNLAGPYDYGTQQAFVEHMQKMHGPGEVMFHNDEEGKRLIAHKGRRVVGIGQANAPYGAAGMRFGGHYRA